MSAKAFLNRVNDAASSSFSLGFGSFSSSFASRNGQADSFARRMVDHAHQQNGGGHRLSISDLVNLPITSARNPTHIGFFSFLLHAFHPARLWNPKHDTKREKIRVFTTADAFVIGFVSLAYFLSVTGISYIGLLAPSLQADSTLVYTPAAHGNLIVTMNILSTIGKLVMGGLNDLTNPRFMLALDFVLSAIFLLVFSLVHSLEPAYNPADVSLLVAMAGLNAFVLAGAWSGCIKFVHDHFRPAQWGRSVTLLAIASRLGAVLTAVALGSIIKSGYPWELAAQVSSFLVFMASVALSFTFCFAHPAAHLTALNEDGFHDTKNLYDALAPPASMHKTLHNPFDRAEVEKDLQHMGSALKHWAGWWTKRQFLTVAFCQGSMGVVGFGLLDFVPLIAINALGADTSTASYCSIGLPLGMALSNALGFFYIERLAGPSKANVVLVFLLLSLVVCVVLIIVIAVASNNGHVMDNGAAVLGVITCVLGFFIGYPYYAPTSAFAMHWGGPEHAALATSSLQFFSGLLIVVFDAVVGSFSSSGNWIAVCCVATAFALVALTTMAMYYHEELLIKKRLVKLMLNAEVAARVTEHDPAPSAAPAARSTGLERMRSEPEMDKAKWRRKDNRNHVRNEVAACAVFLLFVALVAIFASYVNWREGGSTSQFFNQQGVASGPGTG